MPNDPYPAQRPSIRLRFRLVAATVGFAAAIVCRIAFSAPPTTDLPEAVPVDGAPFKARLEAADADWRLTFQPADGAAKQMPAADLCWWGRWAEPSGRQRVLLVDGSLIAADVTALDKDRVTVDWRGPVKLPLEIVAGIMLHAPADPQRADGLAAKLRRASGDADRLLLVNGDELTGEIQELVDGAINLKTTAGPLSIRLDKIAAIVPNPSLAAKPDAAAAKAWLGLADGSRLLVSSLTIDHTTAQPPPAAGPHVAMPVDRLTALQPLGGRTVYLSDLKPAAYKQTPLLNLSWPYRADRNVLDTQLRAGGRLYVKGLGVHSAAQLTYDLDKPCRQFAAETAIDDQTAGRGSAIFRVDTDDGSGALAPPLRRPNPPRRRGSAGRVGRSGGREANPLVGRFRRPRRHSRPRRLAERPAAQVALASRFQPAASSPSSRSVKHFALPPALTNSSSGVSRG